MQLHHIIPQQFFDSFSNLLTTLRVGKNDIMFVERNDS
jgi:hypothetical protein